MSGDASPQDRARVRVAGAGRWVGFYRGAPVLTSKFSNSSSSLCPGAAGVAGPS